MNTTQAQQKALDDALVAPADRQTFEDLPLEHDIISFIRDLGHSGDIIYLTDRENSKTKVCLKKADSDTSPKQKPVQATKAGYQKKQDTISYLISKWLSGEEDKDDESNSVDSSDDHDDDSDDERTESDRDEIPDRNLTNVDQTEHEEEDVDERVHTPSDYELTDDEKNHDENNIDVEERMDEEEDDESGFKQEEDDTHVTLTPVLDTQKDDKHVQSSSVSSDFTSKLLNLENPSPAENEITSLLDTTFRHATTVSEITSSFTTTIPPIPSFFNGLPHHATPTPTPTTSEATTSFPSLLNFSSVFRFNDRVTNLEKHLLELNEVDQYAQAISLIPAIVDRYMDNKLGEAIHKAIQSHNAKCSEEAQAKKQEYIDTIDSTVRTIIREEVKTQLLKILPKAVSDFETPVIQRNVTGSLESVVLKRSSSQPKSTYEAAASLSEFELTKILLDKMKESKSHLRADYKKKLYDALVGSYNTNKDIFELYGTKRRKSNKEAESSKDSRSKEKKSSSTSKDTSKSQHKSSSKSTHAEKPSHTVEDSGMQQDQEFVTGDNDEQPADKEVTKADWFKKLERPPTPDTEWNKRQQGPKRQHFYGLAANMSSLKDVYSRKRIIAVTRLSIMKKYDYGHLEEIEVRREDHKFYKFRKGLECGIMYVHKMDYHSKADGRSSIRCRKLPKEAQPYHARHIRDGISAKEKWSSLDKKRVQVMIQDMDKKLYERRLMRILEKFVGGREYENDLRLLERTI
nr:hypothetical protein [Tanacetum cinerariifolium]